MISNFQTKEREASIPGGGNEACSHRNMKEHGAWRGPRQTCGADGARAPGGDVRGERDREAGIHCGFLGHAGKWGDCGN